MTELYLDNIDEDVAGAVDDKHEMVPPSEIVGPCRPMFNGSVLHHLNCLIEIQEQFAEVTAEEHEDDGTHECSHRGVPSLSTAHSVVGLCQSERKKDEKDWKGKTPFVIK